MAMVGKSNELDQQIDEALDGFLDNMSRRWRPTLALIVLALVFYFFMWPSRGTWGPPLLAITGFLLQLLFGIAFAIIQFVAIFWFLARGRTYWVMPGETGIGFKDYKGNPEVLDAANQIVVLLRGVKEFKAMGGEHIRGLLLVGPPGTGKSYLAQAISTEAGVPFGYVSAPSMTSMFMGVGNLKVMSLYRKARKLARKHGAAILFIDEIDAIGTSRTRGGQNQGGFFGGMMGGGGTGLLNELLMQMDPPPADQGRWKRFLRWLGLRRGGADMPPVLSIAATNIAEALDQALLRPGRFDRKIRIDAPDAHGRREIIDYYIAKVHHDPNIDIDRMVNDTQGYTPVAVKYVINESVVHAHFSGRTEINYEDFTRARDTHEYGLRQPVKAMSALDKRRIAYHEAGHTIAQLEYAPITRQRFAKVTLMRYGNFGAGVGGFSSTKPTEETFGGASTREEVLADIRVSLGSRAAEEVFLETRLSGVGGDFGNATTDAANYLFRWGMDGNIINPFVFTPQMDVDQAMQDKIEALLQEQYTEVKALIERRRDEVEAIAEELIQRDELNSQDVEEILKRVAFAKRIAGNGAHNGSAEDTLLSNLLAAGDLDWREPVELPDPTPVAEPEPEPQ